MKIKGFLFIFLLASVLFVSACSYKNSEVNEVQEINDNFVNTKEAASSSEQLATKECKTEKFLFEYPGNWGECSETENSVSFRTEEDPYQVDLILTMNESTGEEYNNNKEYSFNYNKLNNGNEGFFEVAQGGALMGGFIYLDNYYKFDFNITSNQPVPENLDGVWAPNNNLNENDLVSILKSAKLNN